MIIALKKPRVFIPTAIVFVIVFIIIFGGKKPPTQELVTATIGSVSQIVDVTGRVKPSEAVDLGFAQSGRIGIVSATTYDRVIPVQILVRLENYDSIAALNQAEATLAEERANLAELEQGTRPEELVITETKAVNATVTLNDAEHNAVEVLRDVYTKADDAVHNKVDQFVSNATFAPQLTFTIEAQTKEQFERERKTIETLLMTWKNSLRDLDQNQNLLAHTLTANKNLNQTRIFLDLTASIVNSLKKDSALSQTTIDAYRVDVAAARTNINTAAVNIAATEKELRTAQSALSLAENELALDEAGATPEALAAKRARVAGAEASVAKLRAEIEKTIIRAPFAGIVTRLDAKTGETIGANTVVAGLMAEGIMEIEANISESDITKIAVGSAASITLDAYGAELIFGAIIAKIDPAETILDGVSTYKTTLRFDELSEKIRPGMTANIQIVTNKKDGVVSFPRRAGIRKNGGRFVRLIDDKKTVREIPIVAGLRGSDGNIEIVDGLTAGDKIILFEEQK